MTTDLTRLLHHVLEAYNLPLDGYHGVAHWARVLENGVRLADSFGGGREIVSLFAVLHDCRRVNEDHDPLHGHRAAELARQLRGDWFNLDDDDFKRLLIALEGHSHERHNPDPIIQACWDADRLDLGRVGIVPNAKYLGTPLAKTPEMIDWADQRGSSGFVPELVKEKWGIDLKPTDHKQSE